jgi:hypothetical protein
MRAWATAIAICVFGVPALAQDPAFQATVDPATVGVGEQCTLAFILSNAGIGGGKDLNLPDLTKFRIMSGPNTSSSMQIINGSVSSTVTYSYIIQPKEIGKWTIGPASITAGGKTLTTQPVTVDVVKGSARPKQQPAAQEDVGTQIGDKLLLRGTVDRSHVMQGEQVNVTFKIYARVSVSSYALSKAPTTTGFWGEDVETPRDIQVTTETVNGKQYRVGVVKKMALFPTQSGTLEISPMELQTTIQVQDRRSIDPFDAFFRDPFGRSVNFTITSEPIKIKVDPLPGNAPPEFKGAVGQFGMSATLDKKTTRTNEPVNLKIVVSGTGNIKLIDAPAVELPADFEQYPPKVTENINKAGDRVSGSKTFEYLLMPRYPGLKTIKPVGFAFYDPGKREYVKLHTPTLEINVEQGSAPPQPLIAGGSREDVRLLSQDIRFIKLAEGGLRHNGESPLSLIMVLMVVPLAGVGGAFVYARRRNAEMLDQAGYRNRKALRVARKGLKAAEFLLKEHGGKPASNQRLRFYAEVSHALAKYLGDKLGIPPAAMALEAVRQELQGRKVPEGLIRALSALWETCDMARFAPTSTDVAVMQRTYAEAERIIVEIERTLK